jgi:hypothetical protein
MSIDITKKRKNKNKIVNLKKQSSLHSEKNLEEKFETNFTNISKLAQHQKIRIMWISVIFFSTILVIAWFYLAVKGVIIRPAENNDELATLTVQVSEDIGNIKDKFIQNKTAINKLKNQLEASIVKTEMIDNLKKELEKSLASADFKIDYPKTDQFVDNPIKIFGNAKIIGSQFSVKLFDSRKKLLGQTNGITENENSFSSFALELNYSQPVTPTGYLEFSTLSSDQPEILNTTPITFINNLSEWTEYFDEEYGFKIKLPATWEAKIMTPETGNKYLQLNTQKTFANKENLLTPASDSLIVNFYRNLEDFKQNYSWSKLFEFTTFDDFFAQNTNTELKTNKLIIASLPKESSQPTTYFFYNQITGELVSISMNSASAEILTQITATFKLADSDFTAWKSYSDENNVLTIQYPTSLTMKKNLDQTIFKTKNPEEFSFYIFTLEPQIDNLQKWLDDSAQNLNEKIMKSENKVFGEIFDGIYYESEEKIMQDNTEPIIVKNIDYIFNLNDTTYSIKTNKTDYINTFGKVLDSLKINKIEQ